MPPPDLRFVLDVHDGPGDAAGLHPRYRALVSSLGRLSRAADRLGPLPDQFVGPVQRSVERIFGTSAPEPPGTDEQGRRTASLADALAGHRERTGTLRDAFLTRSADYSGHCALVMADASDADTARLAGNGSRPGAGTPPPAGDTALLPAALAWHLFRPSLVRALVDAGAADGLGAAERMAATQADAALPYLKDVAARSVVLVCLPAGPWRIVALRVRLIGGPALKVPPELFDRVGWENLGRGVRVFGLLTEGAAREAWAALSPAALVAGAPCAAPRTRPRTSLFDLERSTLVDDLTAAVYEGRAFPLAPEDHLLLCDERWP
ncbi:hypothetical protein [Streptomyces sp. G45]|uniref:hypothetical protein n=1 Tax=Streptomyces sp. G45 TaxID=3406627 RepID=UPI003C298000